MISMNLPVADMFKFKQFEIDDSLSAMKIGTDGVLLGAWASVEGCRRFLDVGTGTGLIALMMAQRCAEAHVTAIDIDALAAKEAQYNVDKSTWHSRITVLRADVRGVIPNEPFDHIISNPPYFNDALRSPDVQRSTARHTDTLGYEELVATAERMLVDGGRLSVVLPTEGAALFRRVAFGRLWLCRLTDVVTREGEAPKRTLMEFVLTDSPIMPRCDSLTIHGSDGSYTSDYRHLTEEFYLAF